MTVAETTTTTVTTATSPPSSDQIDWIPTVEELYNRKFALFAAPDVARIGEVAVAGSPVYETMVTDMTESVANGWHSEYTPRVVARVDVDEASAWPDGTVLKATLTVWKQSGGATAIVDADGAVVFPVTVEQPPPGMLTRTRITIERAASDQRGSLSMMSRSSLRRHESATADDCPGRHLHIDGGLRSAGLRHQGGLCSDDDNNYIWCEVADLGTPADGGGNVSVDLEYVPYQWDRENMGSEWVRDDGVYINCEPLPGPPDEAGNPNAELRRRVRDHDDPQGDRRGRRTPVSVRLSR